MWLPDGKKLMIPLAVSTECRRERRTDTDRRTNTLRQHSPCYAYHRAVKTDALNQSCKKLTKLKKLKQKTDEKSENPANRTESLRVSDRR